MHTLWKDLPMELSARQIEYGLEQATSHMPLKYFTFDLRFRLHEAETTMLEHKHAAFLVPPQTTFEKLVNYWNPNYVIEVVTAPLKKMQTDIGFMIYRGDRYSLLLRSRQKHSIIISRPTYLQISPDSKTGKRVAAVIDEVVDNLSSNVTRIFSASQ